MSKLSWIEDLERDGYVVIPAVLTKEDAASFEIKFWDWLESFKTGIKRDDQKTWTKDCWVPNSRGIIAHFGIGQAEWMWELRSLPALKQIFADLYGTKKLWVSFDGANATHKYMKFNHWEHVDQSGKHPDFKCAQGFVNLVDCGPDDGGLIVYKGSHKLHDTYFKAFSDEVDSSNWYRFKDMDKFKQIYGECEKLKVCCNAGDVVLWDSRAVHMTCAPTTDTVRMVAYVCMQPCAEATEKDYKRKKNAFETGRTTNHWPVKFKLNGKRPNFCTDFEDFDKPYKKPKLSEDAMKLAGLKRY